MGVQQIYYPDDGDEVRLTDGRVGRVTSSSSDPVCTGPGDWQVEVEFDEGEDESDVEVSWNEKEKCWEQQEA